MISNTSRRSVIRVAVLVLFAAACNEAPVPAAAPATPPVSPTAAYADSAIPAGPMGASIRRGLALIEHTPDSLPAYVGGNLSCTSCHLERGLRPNASPLIGTYARYPRYLERSGAVVPIEDRVNYCMTRSLAGRALPAHSREMVDMVAYLAFVSRDVGARRLPGEGMPKLAMLTPDTMHGRAVYTDNCVRCHGVDGAGIAVAPALWGAKSYAIGASMARLERAASFVKHNMPFDKPGTLTAQQAFDVMAYVNSHARPDSPGKERDWPNGGAPVDVPYATKGRAPAREPSVIPRRYPDGFDVPIPTAAPSRAGATSR